MSTGLMPINLTFLRTKISKLGTDRKDFKTLRSNKLAVITSNRESEKLTTYIADEFKQYKPKQITDKSINIGGYEVVVRRSRDQRSSLPDNISNEYKFVEYINQAIMDNGYTVSINLKSPNKQFSIKNVIKALHVGSVDIFANKKADVLLQSSNSLVPISLKKENASFWGSPDKELKSIAEKFFTYIIKNKLVQLSTLPDNKNVNYIYPRIAFPLPESIGKSIVFGNDIINNHGAILIRSWKASDFILDYQKENVLDISALYMYRSYSDIDQKHKPYFVFNNDASRKVASNIIPPGIRYSIVYQSKLGQAKIVNYTP